MAEFSAQSGSKTKMLKDCSRTELLKPKSMLRLLP